jgi:hypothetical protein
VMQLVSAEPATALRTSARTWRRLVDRVQVRRVNGLAVAAVDVWHLTDVSRLANVRFCAPKADVREAFAFGPGAASAWTSRITFLNWN